MLQLSFVYQNKLSSITCHLGFHPFRYTPFSEIHKINARYVKNSFVLKDEFFFPSVVMNILRWNIFYVFCVPFEVTLYDIIKTRMMTISLFRYQCLWKLLINLLLATQLWLAVVTKQSILSVTAFSVSIWNCKTASIF